MLRHSLLFAVNVVALATTAAHVQSAQAQSVGAGQQPSAPTVYFGRSSTLQEGVQHGYADVLRADGARTYDLSLAAANFEDAREKYMKNRKEGVRTYFELQMMNKAYRQALAGKSSAKTITPAKSVRSTAEVAPAPIMDGGKIDWPVALRGSASGESRNRLQYVFGLRAAGHPVQIGTPEYRDASQALAQMGAELQGSIRTLPPAEYVAAKQVLKSLKHELAQPAGQQMLSQN